MGCIAPAAPPSSRNDNVMKAIIKFLQEARTELAKVNWPDRKTVINLTLVVIGVSLLFAIFIGLVDYVFTGGVKWLTSFSQSTGQATAPNVNISNVETSPSNTSNQ